MNKNLTNGVIIMSFLKHPFLNLRIGLVHENFAIVKKSDKKLWKARGFKRIRKYPIFRYKPNSYEMIMLGVPSNVEAPAISANSSAG